MTRFYVQSGEDYLVWKLLGEGRATPGYYVGVDALDGRRFSNSYAFEQIGWAGLCVEAHPEYYRQARDNRPRATVVHAACCDRDDQSITFHANDRGTLSGIEPMDSATLEARFSDYFSGYQRIAVPARRLTTMLDDAGAPAAIDFVSIDVEGAELNVLRGLDFGRYTPRVLIIEALEAEMSAAVSAYVGRRGYRLARQLAGNVFFCRTRADARRLARQRVDVPLIHTSHAMDHGEAVVIQPDVRPGVISEVYRRVAERLGRPRTLAGDLS